MTDPRSADAARPKAILVSIQLPEASDIQHAGDVAELGRLVHTLGYEIVATVTQRRHALAPSAVLGDGKLRELAALTGGAGVVPSAATPRKDKARLRREADQEAAQQASEGGLGDDDDADDEDSAPSESADEGDPAERQDPQPAVDVVAQELGTIALIAVDHDISPSQARNLEKATDVPVLDRTGVIVEIFNRHARSREAKLQVEIARLNYVAPRMRETGGGDRQRGGIGGKGAGESALELDRRKIRDRIAELRRELELVQREQGVRRAQRRDQRRVALVGYTNAGKSSLMRALTSSDVYVADKLFATLDTTVRALQPETRPRILISDTVGFIKKLPHDLVASFKSTLDEALEASLLLYVVDASDPTYEAQLEVTQSVLHEIGADEVPSLLILNKMDRVELVARRALSLRHPLAVQLSARDPSDVARLRGLLIAHFDAQMQEEQVFVPYDRQAVVSEIHSQARVLEETYDERGAQLRIRADGPAIARIRSLLAR